MATSSADTNAVASDERGNGPLFEACHEVLAQLELRSVVLEYVGNGHFCFVAAVCKEWKASYATSYPAGKTGYSSVVSSVQCVNWATDRQGLEVSTKLFWAAARYGDVEVCKVLYGKDCPWNKYLSLATTQNRGHGLSVLKWLRSEDLPDKEQCPWLGNGSIMCASAAERGRLEMLKWLMSDEGNAVTYSGAWISACQGGHVPVVAWFFEHPPTRALMEENRDGEWRKGALFAADSGRLEVLQFLHTNARDLCDWNPHVCFNAVTHGRSLAVLKWLRSEEVQCEWDEESCPQLIRDRVYDEWYGEGGIWNIDARTFEEIKQWVHANGHPCDCRD